MINKEKEVLLKEKRIRKRVYSVHGKHFDKGSFSQNMKYFLSHSSELPLETGKQGSSWSIQTINLL